MSRDANYYVTHGSDSLSYYHATGDISALRAAVDDFRRLTLLSRQQSRNVPDNFLLLCTSLKELYDATGDLNARSEAVTVGWQTLELIPEGHTLRTSAPYELGA